MYHLSSSNLEVRPSKDGAFPEHETPGLGKYIGQKRGHDREKPWGRALAIRREKRQTLETFDMFASPPLCMVGGKLTGLFLVASCNDRQPCTS